jgi:hypothetical protein
MVGFSSRENKSFVMIPEIDLRGRTAEVAVLNDHKSQRSNPLPLHQNGGAAEILKTVCRLKSPLFSVEAKAG